LKLKTTAAGKFLKILKELFSKSSLSRRPQTAKLSLALQTGGAPADRLEVVKPPLAGGFTTSPCATFGRAIPNKDYVPAQSPRLGNCIPTQPSRKREGFILYRELYYSAC